MQNEIFKDDTTKIKVRCCILDTADLGELADNCQLPSHSILILLDGIQLVDLKPLTIFVGISRKASR